jgi:hypothetical protein
LFHRSPKVGLTGCLIVRAFPTIPAQQQWLDPTLQFFLDLPLDIVCDILSNMDVTKDYTSDFTEAMHDLLAMASQREQLETRIAKQKKRVAALYELAQIDEGSRPLSGLVEGITDACRVVFRAAEKPLFPAEVRDRVQDLGLPPQANLLASIHTTIKRMKDAKEIDDVNYPLETGGMGTAYQWNDKRNTLIDLLGDDSAFGRFKRAYDARLAREAGKK